MLLAAPASAGDSPTSATASRAGAATRPTATTAPELLAPAGSFDAVRAAVANGADAVYLGAGGFNARDDGAQLTLAELYDACRLAHARGVRVYLTLNVLVKPAELADALALLTEAVDCGIDAVIVQDLGLVRLIRAVHPALEIHGSTQMTVHDASGAALARALGVSRVVMARENTIADLRAIHAAVPDLGVEAFVHGALCISYSGQCFMSGLISDRSANRGSCAQACRKDYVLADAESGETLDTGYLISAKDLAAHDDLSALAAAGVACLKIEGRKKRAEYVATVTERYRRWLDRLRDGERAPPPAAETEPLVQIYSRGFTAGLLHGREGRGFVTRDHPDSRGAPLGTVVAVDVDAAIVHVAREVHVGDGLAFESGGARAGGTVAAVRATEPTEAGFRQTLVVRTRTQPGAAVFRNADAALLARSRASYESVPALDPARVALDVRLFGAAGSPLKAVVTAGTPPDAETVTVRTTATLARADRRPLDAALCRQQLGRLGGTPFVLGALDMRGLGTGLFLPVSELNHLRQAAVDSLSERRDWARVARRADARARIEAAVAAVPAPAAVAGLPGRPLGLAATVYDTEDARAAAAAGATDVVIDPFVRHPSPPVGRLRRLADDLAAGGVQLWLRTPTIIRPAEREALDRWLALELPVLTGHLGLARELADQGRRVVADYAVNCFNAHTAATIFAFGIGQVVLSVELTVDEMAGVVGPWSGAGFAALVYGRPEGMTIEHCVLSAAYDREPTTCRDLCVQRHPHVQLTDPAGYTFAVATDTACRNRLLHSRPIEASEYLPALWRSGVRAFQLVFNVPGDPVGDIVAAYATVLRSIAEEQPVELAAIRRLIGPEFTRGHFARAV